MIMMTCNTALLVDLYELTMAQVYFRHKRGTRATFDLFARQLPAQRSFLIAAGLEDILAYIRGLRFTADSIRYLESLGLFSGDFLRYLAGFRFTGDIWAMPEGTLVFPHEPIVRVTAPIMEAQMVEGFLLNTINLQTMIASKAARVVLSAQGRPVYDFSLRRTHGADASIKVARSSYLAGIQGTSNVLAGKLYGMALSGTMAHSYVMAFPCELEAFRAYAGVFGSKTILLVDTYDVPEGIRNAIRVAVELEADGKRLLGIRIDSGDIVKLSFMARETLD
ncbi:MAG: nicotinate phosphoribosyltransferase, partial [Candidatus Omnitrophota bacterium]